MACLCIGCNADEEVSLDTTFEVVVAGNVYYCGLPLIQLKEKLEQAEQISGITGWSVYQAYNLDSSLSHDGQRLMIKIRKTNADESMPCITLGPTYPAVTIVEARLKE